MEFLKGTILGMIAGTYLGVMKNDMFYDAIKKGKKEIKKLKKNLSF